MAEKKATIITDDATITETHTAKTDFWTAYSKPIIIAGSAIILLLAAWFGYKKLIKEPKEEKALVALYPAEAAFDKMASGNFTKDTVGIVLNGGQLNGEKVTGLLKIMNTYGGTDAANRATYMTGASYMQIGDFEKAIKYLKDFDPNGASQLEIKKNIMLGHAYAEQKKTDDALSYYKKAASVNEKDDAYTADALIIAASYAEANGKDKDAIELYEKARDNYAAFPAVQNGDVEKHLAKLGIYK